jgi:hypothetical protein
VRNCTIILMCDVVFALRAPALADKQGPSQRTSLSRYRANLLPRALVHQP